MSTHLWRDNKIMSACAAYNWSEPGCNTVGRKKQSSNDAISFSPTLKCKQHQFSKLVRKQADNVHTLGSIVLFLPHIMLSHTSQSLVKVIVIWYFIWASLGVRLLIFPFFCQVPTFWGGELGSFSFVDISSQLWKSWGCCDIFWIDLFDLSPSDISGQFVFCSVHWTAYVTSLIWQVI